MVTAMLAVAVSRWTARCDTAFRAGLHAAPSSLGALSRTDVITGVCVCANHQEIWHLLEEGM